MVAEVADVPELKAPVEAVVGMSWAGFAGPAPAGEMLGAWTVVVGLAYMAPTAFGAVAAGGEGLVGRDMERTVLARPVVRAKTELACHADGRLTGLADRQSQPGSVEVGILEYEAAGLGSNSCEDRHFSTTDETHSAVAGCGDGEGKVPHWLWVATRKAHGW